MQSHHLESWGEIRKRFLAINLDCFQKKKKPKHVFLRVGESVQVAFGFVNDSVDNDRDSPGTDPSDSRLGRGPWL